MGLVKKKQALYADAEDLYKKQLAILTKSYGEEHPKVAFCLCNLGDIYR